MIPLKKKKKERMTLYKKDWLNFFHDWVIEPIPGNQCCVLVVTILKWLGPRPFYFELMWFKDRSFISLSKVAFLCWIQWMDEILYLSWELELLNTKIKEGVFLVWMQWEGNPLFCENLEHWFAGKSWYTIEEERWCCESLKEKISRK